MYNITIIGPGLIGASLGLCLKKYALADKIHGMDIDKVNLKKAKSLNAIDEAHEKIGSYINESDIVFVCTPVGAFQKIFESLNKFLTKKTIVSDVGSVKGFFLKKPFNKFTNLNIIPGHPIAGTEFSGAANSKIDMFENKWCILTPISKSKSIKVIENIWKSMNMRVEIMSPNKHDKIMSVTSHLPHLIAFTIVGTAFNLSSRDRKSLLNFSAGGFKDFTRIGSSDPKMWHDIFLQNKKFILSTLEKFGKDLDFLKMLIKTENSEKILNILKKNKTIRQKISKLS